MHEHWQDAGRRREHFEEEAEAYHRLRPRYPLEMYDDLERLARLRARSLIVEVGSGTGIATGTLVERGHHVICVEPSTKLSAIARADHGSGIEVVNARFEDWDAPAGIADVVFAATSWHWIEPSRGFGKAASLLRPAGHLALAWQILLGIGPGELAERVAELYGALAPELAGGWSSQTSTDRDWDRRIVESGLFRRPAQARHRFRRHFDADSFVALTFTYGDHLSLPPARRDRLASALRELIVTGFPDGVYKDEESALLVAALAAGRPSE